jgi:hypothetical protein
MVDVPDAIARAGADEDPRPMPAIRAKEVLPWGRSGRTGVAASSDVIVREDIPASSPEDPFGSRET